MGTARAGNRARTWAAAPGPLNGEWGSTALGGDIHRPPVGYFFLIGPTLMAHSHSGWGSEHGSLNSPKSWADGIICNAHTFLTFGCRWASYLPVSPSALLVLPPQPEKAMRNTRLSCSSISYKLTLSSRHVFDPWPPVEEHGAVMVHVQKSHLLLFLAQN